MKDIKTFLIGFLSCACLFLIMGQTSEMFVTTTDNGKYQAYSAEGFSYLIETNTGIKYRFNPIKKKWMKQSIEGEIFNQ
tara:strand:+ start:234 stop:470 length:237 start_codon:yes stop_codon:yes gene_type:complete